MKVKSENLKIHEPVLVKEVIESLHIEKGGRYIDATLGTGGHALAILKKGGQVLGIEADPEILKIAQKRLKKERLRLVHGNFRDIGKIGEGEGFTNVDGIIFDLGVANPQLTSESRGFSFQKDDVPLDMRIDPGSQGITAADLLNALRKDQLTSLFEPVLGWKEARKIVSAILARREISGFRTVGDFLEVARSLKSKNELHFATLPFLALRIAVNTELENLREAMPQAYGLLKKGGRLAVISFHSLEDRIVKNFFKNLPLVANSESITPTKEEIERNPRSRSARLRVIKKI